MGAAWPEIVAGALGRIGTRGPPPTDAVVAGQVLEGASRGDSASTRWGPAIQPPSSRTISATLLVGGCVARAGALCPWAPSSCPRPVRPRRLGPCGLRGSGAAAGPDAWASRPAQARET